ncbi:MAG: glycosyltransferase family 39 protein [Pseudomonadota bacterium]
MSRSGLRNLLTALGPAGGRCRAFFSLIRKHVALFCFIVIIFIHLAIALCGVSMEWVFHHHGWNGARRSINARNYLRFGYIETRLAPLDNLGPAKGADGKPKKMWAYWHHPPGFAILLSFAYAILGESETVARLLAVSLTLASFIMLITIFRRSWGDGPTLLACVFLTFLPIYASYMNFVNFEPLVIASMFGVICVYESYRRSRKWWKLMLLGLVVLVGGFSDFPFYPFLFFFWLILIAVEFSGGIRNWKLPVIFVPIVLVAGALVVLQFISMQDSFKSFLNLFNGRRNLSGDQPYLIVLEKWKYYLPFFNPVTIVFTAYWLLDLVVRALLRRLRRADGYILALLLPALTYWLLIPQGAKIHEYCVLYFSPALALAAGGGLWRFAEAASYNSRPIKIVVAVLVAGAFVMTSVPIIYAKKISPSYEFKTPLHEMAEAKNFDLQMSYNVLARFFNGKMKPEETLAHYDGFDLRPEFKYYFDRKFVRKKNRLDLIRLEKQKDYPFVFINQRSVWTDFLAYLIQKHRFVFYDHYYGFDLRGRLKGDTVLAMKFPQSGPVGRYLYSLNHPYYTIEEDKWRGLDLAVKLRDSKAVEAAAAGVKGLKPGSAGAAIADYNYRLMRNEKPDLKSVTDRLDLVPKDKTIFGKVLEYIGAGLEKAQDGRTVVRLAFMARRGLDHNFGVELYADPLHEDKEVQKALGKTKIDMRFVIPTSMWKSGYVYFAESPLQLYPGPYELAFKVRLVDTYQVINSASNENAFSAVCKVPPGDPLESLAQITSRIMEIDAMGPMDSSEARKRMSSLPAYKEMIRKDLGEDLVLHACSIVPVENKKWLIRLYLQNVSMRGRTLTIKMVGMGGGKDRKGSFTEEIEMEKLTGDRGPGHFFWVDKVIGDDPVGAKIELRLGSETVPSPLENGRGKDEVKLKKGNFGIDFPMVWLNWPMVF